MGNKLEIKMSYITDLRDLRKTDTHLAGGKGANLGEMIANLTSTGVDVPPGFVITTNAWKLLLKNGIGDYIENLINATDIDDTHTLEKVSKTIRNHIENSHWPDELVSAVKETYQNCATEGQLFAVRSSATAEDAEDASFAGQQDTILGVSGADNLIVAAKRVFASLYTTRAISYRKHNGYGNTGVAMAVVVQRMVRSDVGTGAAGVAFTVDPDSGFDGIVVINSALGLGESVVSGSNNPDEVRVSKHALSRGFDAVISKRIGTKEFRTVIKSGETTTACAVNISTCESLQHTLSITKTDAEIIASNAIKIEKHYNRPMDIEWAKDGIDGRIYIVQCRPETVKSRNKLTQQYTICSKNASVLTSGRAVGQKVATGVVRVVKDVCDMHTVKAGDILVTDMTTPDWEPAMQIASAIVTNRGGRTCHAAIIARELGLPALVGCEDATDVLFDGDTVTVSCAEGDTGFVYEGNIPFTVRDVETETNDAPVKLTVNIGNPEHAFEFAQMKNDGVGLARLEFLISQTIGVHPAAVLAFPNGSGAAYERIRHESASYSSPKDWYVSKIAEGVSTIACAFIGKPVIIRFSDFKSNEYAALPGGELYEAYEENPMIGNRGASRYASEMFKKCFRMECEAIKRVRDVMGWTNVEVMIPFVRTVAELDSVIALMANFGLIRGENGLRIIMMCEIPSNALLAEEFLKRVDGFSIGSNDLTQLTLGIDRDAGGALQESFDEQNMAVKTLIKMAISACRASNKYIGICGQAPSDYPEFALWLVEQGISAISLNPDSLQSTRLFFVENS